MPYATDVGLSTHAMNNTMHFAEFFATKIFHGIEAKSQLALSDHCASFPPTIFWVVTTLQWDYFLNSEIIRKNFREVEKVRLTFLGVPCKIRF
jgi:hypothetical protein